MDKRITCSDCPLECIGTDELCEDNCSDMADFIDEIKSEVLDKVMQKQRTIIDDDGVMYRVVLLKDIEDLKKEVSE